jgi:hypothetical protein
MAIPATADPILGTAARPRERSLAARLGTALVVATLLVAGAHLALRRSDVDAGFVHLDKVNLWWEWRDRYMPAIRASPRTTLALLGDSVMVGRAPLGVGAKNMAACLDDELKRIAPDDPLRVAMLGWPGQSLFERYFLADELMATGARSILFPFNLGSASNLFRATTSTELSGWIPFSRWAEAAALPLADIGLGVDQVALYGSGRALDAVRPWQALRRDQARLAALLERLQDRLLTRPDGRTQLLARTWQELGRRVSARNYQPVFAGLDRDHPAMRVLEATLRIYREHGARVLLFVDPIDLQDLAANGFPGDSPGLRRSLQTVAEIAAENGATFVDLHDALPHAAFLDPMGHLRWDGDANGTQMLAEVLAPHVARAFAPDR